MCPYTESDIKELANAIMKRGKSKNLQSRPAGWSPRDELKLQFRSLGCQAGDPGERASGQLKPKGYMLQNFPPAFYSIQNNICDPPTWWSVVCFTQHPLILM